MTGKIISARQQERPESKLAFKLIDSIGLISIACILVSATSCDCQPSPTHHNRVIFPGPVAMRTSNGASTVASRLPNRNQTQQSDEPAHDCIKNIGCSRRALSPRADSDAKPSCYCDQFCPLYDNCCNDSRWAEPLERRLKIPYQIARQRRRSDWHCKQINRIFGSILVKAKCHPEWPSDEHPIRQRCEMSAAINRMTNSDHVRMLQLDPLGVLLPITDVLSGITYANSYCLRCNTILKESKSVKSRYAFWSPYVTCSYDSESDDRNALYDLVNIHRGRALRYSIQKSKWLIVNATENTIYVNNNGNSTTNMSLTSSERECQIVPTMPDSAEHAIKYCHPNMVDYCPPQPILQISDRNESHRAITECHYGHQAIVYGRNSGAIYYNPACARCNNESHVTCEPRPSQTQYPVDEMYISKKIQMGMMGQQAPPPIEGVQESAGTQSRGSSTGVDQQTSTGSFSLLMDLHGAFQGDASSSSGDPNGGSLVGAMHRCEDAESQVYDPFLLTCRDIVCGLNHRFVDGSCIEAGKKSVGNSNANRQEAKLETVQLVSEVSTGTLADNSSRSDTPQKYLNSSGLAGASTGSALTDAVQASVDQVQKGVPTKLTTTAGVALAGDQKHLVIHDAFPSEQKSISDDSSRATITTSAASLPPRSLPFGSQSNSGSVATDGSSDNEQAKRRFVQFAGKNNRSETHWLSSPSEKLVNIANTDVKLVSAAFDGRARQVMNEALRTQLSVLSKNPAELPQPSARSRRQFAECGKIVIEPEHYQLFTMKDLHFFSQTDTSQPDAFSYTPANVSSDVTLNRTRHTAEDLVWAIVLPYNLTLGPNDFELVHSKADANDQASNLLVCSPFKNDLVSKFNPAMAYLTICCLVISITSLVCYLLLYFVSTFDLRSLIVEMNQADNSSNNSNPEVDRWGCCGCWSWSSPLDSKFRGSRASNDAVAESARSQRLSSRGVACLSGALLVAYLLFIVGHQQQQQKKSYTQKVDPEIPADTIGACALIATGTYYFFLLAFSWMFLLSYDIWRTLRLATCCLRAPATHSQWKRFIAYAMCAFLFASLVSTIAFTLDQIDIDKSPCLLHPRQHIGCSGLRVSFEHFVQDFRPKFGQRPGSCWFSNKRSLALFFGLPVTFIMATNLIFFLHSSFMVVKTSSRSSRRPVKQSSSSSFQSGLGQIKPSECQATLPQNSRIRDQPPELLRAVTSIDFTQQNNLTSSSFASVQTVQSNLDLSSVTASRRDSTDSTSTITSLHRQNSMSESANSSSSGYISTSSNCASKTLGGQLVNHVSTQHFDERPVGKDVKQMVAGNHIESSCSLDSSTSKFTTTKANILNKCDLQLNQLSALVSSLIKDYRLYCRLITIMGLTWLIGLIASMVDQSNVLWYIFVILNTLQGLFIFIAFGLKRSKLTNFSILLCYIFFRFSKYLGSTDKKCGQSQDQATSKYPESKQQS